MATPVSAVAVMQRYSDARDALEVHDTLSPNWWFVRTSSVTAYPFQSPQDRLWSTLIGLDTMVIVGVIWDAPH